VRKKARFKEFIRIIKMSIKGDVIELNLINAEIKQLSNRTRSLRKKAKEVEARILNYLQEKEQPGVKYNGTAVIIENKTKRASKKSKDREVDALQVLKDNGIQNARDVLDQIIEARKGESIPNQKIRIKKLSDV
jgi:hypothetical protein